MDTTLFAGWQDRFIETRGGARIRVRHAGSGPPLLLLHGNPQTHVAWHRVAPRLAERFTTVVMDLRGYGDSTGPGDPEAAVYDPAAYTFRAMGEDAVEVMAALGHARFGVCGQDRGARVAHRMCLDRPDAVSRVAILDILPQRHVWAHASRDWAMKSWHWVFMPQEEGLPEGMMEAVPPAWYMERKIGKKGIGISIFDPRAFAEYVRCFTPKTIRASCADYRACATIGLRMDEIDHLAGRRIACPTLVLWGRLSHTQAVFDDIRPVWRDYVSGELTGAPVKSGHYLAEHAPEEVLGHLLRHFGEG
jgi:haloacetate dehalogenase